MAFANLFTSLKLPHEDVTPLRGREEGKLAPDKDDEKHEQSRKRHLPIGQQSGPPKKKKKKKTETQQSPSKEPERISNNQKATPPCHQTYQRPNARDYLTKKQHNKQPGLDFSKELQAWTRAKNHYRNAQKADQSKNIQAKNPGPNNGVRHQQDREFLEAEQPWKRTRWEPNQQSHGSWRGNSTDRDDRHANGPGGFAPSTRGRGFAYRGVKRGGSGRGQRASDSPRKMGDHSWRGGGSADRRGHGRGADRSLRGGQTRQLQDPEKAPVVELKRHTQEFMDQNVIKIDGKFICKHFLRGNCLKGEECQLEHPALQNNMLKEACKFYIQGYCYNGAKCPYMHQDFPCKFFHSRRVCTKEDTCRFSHEPLTDLTRRLLDEALKKEQELILAQSMNKDPPMTTEEPKPLIDISLPLTLSFYNSSGLSEPDAEKSAPLWNKAVSQEAAEEETPHTYTPALNPPSTPASKEPASYYIEAVLGSSRLFDTPKPSSVFTPPVNRPSPGHCSRWSPDRTSSSADRHGKASELPQSYGHQEEPPHGIDVSTSDKTVVGSDKPFETPYQNLFSGPLGQSSSPNCQANMCLDPTHTSHGGKALSPPDKSALGTPLPPNKSFLSVFAGPICLATAPKCPAQTKLHTQMTLPGPPEQTPNPPHPPRATDSKRTASRFIETVVSSKPQKTPFRSLFSGPIGQNTTPQPPNPTIPDTRTTPSGQEDSMHTPTPPPSPRESKVKPLKPPFHNLFLGLDDQSPNHTPPTGQSPNPSTSSSGHKGEVPCLRESHKPLDKPFCSLFASPISEAAAPRSKTRTKPEPVDTKAKARLPELTSDREPAKTNSVLKSLFLRLSPRRHEQEQGDGQKLKDCKDTGSDALGLGGKSKSTRESACTENQSRKEAEERMEEDEGQTDDKKVPKYLVPDSEAFGPRDSVSEKAAVTERPSVHGHVRVGTSGFRNLPVRPLASMTRPHLTPRTSPRKIRAQVAYGKARPLKDLFSTFDPTASPFGQQLFTQ